MRATSPGATTFPSPASAARPRASCALLARRPTSPRRAATRACAARARSGCSCARTAARRCSCGCSSAWFEFSFPGWNVSCRDGRPVACVLCVLFLIFVKSVLSLSSLCVRCEKHSTHTRSSFLREAKLWYDLPVPAAVFGVERGRYHSHASPLAQTAAPQRCGI